jgi:glycerol-3-phosphate acyltransferase PlsY
MCALLYPLLLHAFIPGGWTVLMGLMTTVFVVFMHRENIKRLLAGKESKISFGKKKTADTTSTETPTGGTQE